MPDDDRVPDDEAADPPLPPGSRSRAHAKGEELPRSVPRGSGVTSRRDYPWPSGDLDRVAFRRHRAPQYTLSTEQMEALRLLALSIRQTVDELNPGALEDFAAVADGAGMKRYRLRQLLGLWPLDDDQLEAVRVDPKELRRPRRSTLDRLAAALKLSPKVVDVWCKECPQAIARERPE